MAFSPTNAVHLLGVPLDTSRKNQIYFDTRQKQYDYFLGCKKFTVTPMNYIQKDSILYVPKSLDALWNVNYVMYQNKDFNDRWFYAFITKREWLSADATALTLETDEWQTWYSDVTRHACFVVREHSISDDIASNTVDEGLEVGEYYINKLQSIDGMTNLAYIVGLSDLQPLSGIEHDTIGKIYGNVYSGITYYAYKQSEYNALREMIHTYVVAGKENAVMFIAVVPDFVLDNHYGNLLDGVQAGSIQVKFSKYDRNSLNGYIPRNKKLFTYPYSFLYVSNNQGKSAEYRYEDFKMVTGDEAYDATFYVLGNISPNPKVMIAPYGYRNYDLVNTEYGLTMEGYPLCSWNNDLFAGWLAQNSLTWGVGTVASMGAVIGGVASGNPTVAMGGAFGTFNQLQQLHKEAIQPNQAGGNINNGSLNLTWNKQNFYLMDMSVKYQYAKIIDNYFQMYGYKANVVKIPNVKARNKFTYVQTIDCLITGNIPDEDLNRMKTMFNNGVTFWTNAVYIGMYNSENDPLT